MNWHSTKNILETSRESSKAELVARLGQEFLDADQATIVGACHWLFLNNLFSLCINLVEWTLMELPEAPAMLVSKLRYLQADAMLSTKDFDSAVVVYSDLIEEQPTDIAYANRGLANWELGSYDEALSDYLEAIKLNPLNALALRGAGEMLVRRNKIDDAIAYFERALLINTNYINAYRSVGIACYKAGDFARSQKALKEVLRLKPDDEVAQRGITKLLEE